MKCRNFALICVISIFLLVEDSHSLKTKPKTKPKPKPSKPKVKVSETQGIVPEHFDDRILIRVLQIKSSKNKSPTEVIVPIPKDGEIVVGKGRRVGEKSKLILQCSAPFPVQWLYSGNGVPEIVTNTSVIRSPKRGTAYVANAVLGYEKKLQETDTGEYICRKAQIEKNDVPLYTSQSLYIYVTGKSLFVQKSGDILDLDDRNRVTIPCSVSNPDAIVTLQRYDDGFLKCPSQQVIKFSPESGFLVTSSPRGNQALLGNYICIASLNGTQQVSLVKYKVQNKSVNGERRQGQKHKNIGGALKQFLKGVVQIVSSREDDVDDGFEDVIPRNDEICQPSNPCGPNSVCKTNPGKSFPRCSCLPSFIGRPPHCRPECVLHNDCPYKMSCIGQTCVNACANHCAPGATCEVINGMAKCSCPPGTTGNAERNGKCGRTRAPSQEYFPIIRPESNEATMTGIQQSESGYLEFGSTSSEETYVPQMFQNFQNQNRFSCEPWPCGPNSECRPVGESAHCSCSKGYIGTPPNCRPECEINSHCPEDLSCIELKCRDPCFFNNIKCGIRAKCMTVDHSPRCYCPKGMKGDPLAKCRPQQNQQYPPNENLLRPPYPDSSRPPQNINNNKNPNYPPQNSNRPPFKPQPPMSTMMRPNRPVGGNGGNYPGGIGSQQEYPNSPCSQSPCGKNAICTSRNETVGCKCPQGSGFGSDPYVECYPSKNPCEVCGPHSECSVKKGRPVQCSCLPGKSGQPPNCREEQCRGHRDCPQELHCYRGRCDDPCKRADCGRYAICRGMRHLAVCACRNAPDKDPLLGCPPPRGGSGEGDYTYQDLFVQEVEE